MSQGKLLSSGDPFADALERYVQNWREARARGASHDQLRHLFTAFLASAFPSVETWELELEKHIKALGVRGFIDLLYRNIVFEFKRDLAAEHTAGEAELTRYMGAQSDPSQTIGLLTDGGTFGAYILRDGKLSRIDEFRLNADDVEAARLALDCYLFAARSVVPTAEDIVRRFGESSPVLAAMLSGLAQAYTIVSERPEIRTKFSEWDNLLAHVYGSSVGTQPLFLRHTYLALFTRLLAYTALQGRIPESGELAGLVDGNSFKPLGISNLVEEDFFVWVLESEIASETIRLLRGLAQHLSVYDFSRISEDVLKELYQHIIARDARHDIGEYYTPDWLAELTLDEVGFGPGKSLLDPACGSGTFLFIAIRKLRATGVRGKRLVQHVFENLAGLDVHPVAVMIAKVNFVLAVLPELREGLTADLPPLPIFMADTLNVPMRPRDPGVKVPVNVTGPGPKKPRDLPSQFIVPRRLASAPADLDAIIDRTAALARAGEDVDEKSLTTALREFAEGLGYTDETPYLISNFRLLRWLSSPNVNRNSVWTWILRNAYRPSYFSARKFDVVAGNPPWLAYRFITRKDYQEEVKLLTLQVYALLEGKDRRLFTHMDLSTLFFAHSLTHFLNKDGSIALVMPRSVLTGAKHHARFQRRYRFTRILDFEGVTPLFNVPSCVLILKPEVAA